VEISLSVPLDLHVASASFGRVESILTDTASAMKDAASIMSWSVLTNFAAGGRPKPWKELAESTVLRKGHSVPLVETGRLMGGMREESDEVYAKISASVPYAVYHQTGTEHVPARPFMLIHFEDRAAILNMLSRRLTEVV